MLDKYLEDDRPEIPPKTCDLCGHEIEPLELSVISRELLTEGQRLCEECFSHEIEAEWNTYSLIEQARMVGYEFDKDW